MRKQIEEKKTQYIISIVAILAMWIVWLIAHWGVGNDYVVPSVSQTIREIGLLFLSARFWIAFGMTLGRSVFAWGIAFILAGGLVSLCVLNRLFYRFFIPFIGVLRALPTMAITLMLLIWTSPRVAPMIVAFFMLFPLWFTQLTTAYRGIDFQLSEVAQVYRIKQSDRLIRMYIPQMLPSIFAQAGANLSLTLKVMISAEVLSSTFRSIGGLIYEASVYSQTATMFALTILMLVVGGALEFSLNLLTKITDRWVKGRGNTMLDAEGSK